jgi:hypothetical protein
MTRSSQILVNDFDQMIWPAVCPSKVCLVPLEVGTTRVVPDLLGSALPKVDNGFAIQMIHCDQRVGKKG